MASARAAEFAELYLHAGANDLPCSELARALAEAVLGLPKVELAMQVLEGGPHAHAAATELARRLIQGGKQVAQQKTTVS